MQSRHEAFRASLQSLLRTGSDVFAPSTNPHVRAAFRDFEVAGRHLLAEADTADRPVKALERVEFDPRDCIHDTWLAHREAAQAKGLNFTLRITGALPQKLIGDAGRVRRVVSGFLERAVAYTDTGSVRCEVTHLEEDGKLPHRVLIRIRDTGTGFDYAQTKVLFDFDDSASRNLVQAPGIREMVPLKQLVEEMGGELSVFSQKTFGTTVSITIWFGATRGTNLVELSRDIRLANVPVLLADRPRPTRDALAAQMRAMGISLTVVDDGVEALQAVLRAVAEGRPYDLVITDLGTDHLGGVDFARYLQRRGLLKASCLVATTEHGMPGDAELCKRAGFSAYFVVPLPPEHLANLLKATLATLVMRAGDRDNKGLITRHHAREFEKAEGQVVYFAADDTRLHDHALSGIQASVTFAGSLDRLIQETARRETRLIVVDRQVTLNGVRRGLEVIRRSLAGDEVPPIVLIGSFDASERVAYRRYGISGFETSLARALKA